MGCNCSKPKPLGSKPNPGTGLQGQTQSFTLRREDGTTETFGSALEAKAASIRSGGGTITFG